MIPTKRVNKDRRSVKSILLRRLFLASGGYSTLYVSTLALYATHLHFQLSNTPYPHLPIPYLPKNLSKPVFLAGSFIAGFSYGLIAIGNKNEFSHLL